MKEFSKEITLLFERLVHARRALLVAHKNPDGDTFGSILALYQYCSEHTIPCDTTCANEAPDYFSFLPEYSKVRTISEIDITLYDVVVICDAGTLTFAGIAKEIELIRKNITLINIDHHVTNERYGDINIVVPNASSTCEVLTSIFKYASIPITPDMATCLLNGIITDTVFFTTTVTSALTLAHVSFLVEMGARYYTTIRNNFAHKTPQQLAAWGKALSTITENDKHKLAYICIPPDDTENTSGLSNFLMNLSGYEYTLVLKENNDGTVRGSMRTTNPEKNVKKLAEFLGGGGHQMAAGFTIKGRIIENKDGKWQVIE